jgi:hypothetical protein
MSHTLTFNTGYTNIQFLGFDNFTLRIHTRSSEHYGFTQSMSGGTPFNSVRNLRLFFRTPTAGIDFFFGLLRPKKGLYFLRMIQNTVGPLARWIEEGEGVGICPDLTY